jgi:hypothetical protein
MVDDEDFDALNAYRWSVDKGYAKRNIPHPEGGVLPNGKARRCKQLMHRVIMGLGFRGELEVDHIDGNGLNNQRSNLRIATRVQNARNVGMRRTNTSGYKGVMRHKGRWTAVIKLNGNQKHIGYYDDPAVAFEAYKRAAVEIHGEFANFGE